MTATWVQYAGWLWLVCIWYVIGGAHIAFVCCESLQKLCAGAGELGCAFAGEVVTAVHPEP